MIAKAVASAVAVNTAVRATAVYVHVIVHSKPRIWTCSWADYCFRRNNVHSEGFYDIIPIITSPKGNTRRKP